MISVPILGGIAAAERELILIAAGAKTYYDQSESILKDISKQVFYIDLITVLLAYSVGG